MNYKVRQLIDRIRLEIDQAEVYKNSVHFNQARTLLSNDLIEAIEEPEEVCEEKHSQIALKSL